MDNPVLQSVQRRTASDEPFDRPSREAEKPQDTEKSGSAMVSSDYAALLPLGLPDIREFRVALPDLLIGSPDLPANFRRQLIPPAVVHSPQFGF